MNTLDKFRKIKAEINHSWLQNFTSKIVNSEIRVYDNSYHIITITEDFSLKIENEIDVELEEELNALISKKNTLI